MEYNKDDRATMEENIDHFGLHNIQVIDHVDEETMKDCPVPSLVFMVASAKHGAGNRISDKIKSKDQYRISGNVCQVTQSRNGHRQSGISLCPEKCRIRVKQSDKWERQRRDQKIDLGIVHNFLLYISENQPKQRMAERDTHSHQPMEITSIASNT